MVSVYSVDPNALIEKVAEELKKTDLVEAPEWAKFVKTGVSKQRPPVNDDWWYVRAASILRSVYKLGPVGTSKLRTKYGGKQNRGVRPEKFRLASGNIIRTALQQLEKEGYVAQNKDPKKKGRIVTGKGQSLLEKTAVVIMKESRKDAAPVKEEVKKEKKTAAKKEEKAETPTVSEKKAE